VLQSRFSEQRALVAYFAVLRVVRAGPLDVTFGPTEGDDELHNLQAHGIKE